MTRTPEQALAAAKREHDNASRNWAGWCLIFARTMFGIAAKYPSAAAAWTASNRKHRTTVAQDVPRGVPVWWTGGAGGFGHVAISTGNGWCWSTDFARKGKVDHVKIDDVTRGWGLKFQGWTEDVNDVRVYTPTINKLDPANYGMGKRNSAVKWLKARLAAKGYRKGLNLASSTFGAGTRAQVATYQRAQGWTGRDADGLPGRETLRRLNK